MNKLTATSRFRRARASLAALAVVAATFGSGCAVDVDEPVDATAELVDDLEAANASGAEEVTTDDAPIDRQAILEDIARDYELGRLSDREWVLVELLRRQIGDPIPELVEAEPFDPGVVERERIDVGEQVPGVEVGQ